VRKVIRRDTRQTFAAKIYESFMVKARHELELLVRLDHPSIVNVYEVYEEEQCVILILDFMAGGELYDQISQRKRLTEQEVR
jgi:NUAK family SNF1-like kinase